MKCAKFIIFIFQQVVYSQKYDVTLHTQTDSIILQWSVSNYYIIVNEHSSSCFTSIHCMRDAVLAAIESCFFRCD